MKRLAETTQPIHELLEARWSPRAFSSQPVETAKLQSLFEAARWSPSGGNTQPWYFVIVTKADGEIHQRLVETTSGQNLNWTKNVPVLVLAVAKLNAERPAFNKYAYYDLGQSIAHLSVQAGALGLHVHQMGGFDGEKTRELFKIPAGYEPVTLTAIGYAGKLEDLPLDLQARETAPRIRKPANEFVFENQWGQPAALFTEREVAA